LDEKIAKAVEGNNDILQILIENREAPLTVRITEQFRAPVIAAATESMDADATKSPCSDRARLRLKWGGGAAPFS
jgi:hypothetical protein